MATGSVEMAGGRVPQVVQESLRPLQRYSVNAVASPGRHSVTVGPPTRTIRIPAPHRDPGAVSSGDSGGPSPRGVFGPRGGRRLASVGCGLARFTGREAGPSAVTPHRRRPVGPAAHAHGRGARRGRAVWRSVAVPAGSCRVSPRTRPPPGG